MKQRAFENRTRWEKYVEFYFKRVIILVWIVKKEEKNRAYETNRTWFPGGHDANRSSTCQSGDPARLWEPSIAFFEFLPNLSTWRWKNPSQSLPVANIVSWCIHKASLFGFRALMNHNVPKVGPLTQWCARVCYSLDWIKGNRKKRGGLWYPLYYPILYHSRNSRGKWVAPTSLLTLGSHLLTIRMTDPVHLFHGFQ